MTLITLHKDDLIDPSHPVFALEPGNGSRFECFALKRGGTLHLAIEGRGAYHFNVGTASPGYVAEKLGLRDYMGDAELIAAFVNHNLLAESLNPYA